MFVKWVGVDVAKTIGLEGVPGKEKKSASKEKLDNETSCTGQSQPAWKTQNSPAKTQSENKSWEKDHC